ncbi:glycoside hydrolase family 9 protein [candidate division KSB1 bacterium]|nr:glycoside hydrolase family 9 protein [candidate division KSB1 bacterium]
MAVYEMRPENFSDDELNIPESGNGLPDVLDEARWCVDFYKSMQEADGGIHGGIETHRHPGTGISCVTDADQWYAYAPDPIASFHYAAAACHFAQCLTIAESSENTTEYIQSAESAYQWALENTKEEDWNSQNIRDMRHYGSAWLFRQTGKKEYHDQFKEDNMVTSANTELEVWESHDQQWGIYTYCMAKVDNIDEDLRATLIKAVERWAYTDHIDNADRRGYRFGNDWWLPISWGHAIRCRTFPVTMAYYLTGDEKYLAYHYTTCDYVLGANPLNMCWVSGIGEKYPKEIMHLDSWYYNTEKGMVPGLIPFGPTSYTDDSPDGPWEISWGMSTAYPPAEEWPSHELYFENRYCPPMNEFTVHSTIAPAAAAFGFLCNTGGKYTRTGSCQPTPAIGFRLLQNYPNPFNPVTTIGFETFFSGRVFLRIFNLRGQHIKTLLNDNCTAGYYTYQWDGRDKNGQKSASGIYLVHLKIGDEQRTVKIALVR